jgi:hypothetical protein
MLEHTLSVNTSSLGARATAVPIVAGSVNSNGVEISMLLWANVGCNDINGSWVESVTNRFAMKCVFKMSPMIMGKPLFDRVLWNSTLDLHG